MQIIIDDKIILKNFTRHNPDALELSRIYYLCNHAFKNRSGVFSLEELADLLYQYGYRSLRPGSGGNRSRKTKQLHLLLKSAPELFIESKPGIFRVISKHKANRRKPGQREIKLSFLHKNHKREFYDLCIGIVADGRTIDYKTIAKTTGHTRARVCQAMKANHKHGLILKVNNEIVLSSHNSYQEALKARLKLFRGYYKIISHIQEYDNQFHVVLPGANSYTSSMLNPIYGKPQPILNKKHNSTVFTREILNGIKALCYFNSEKTETGYLWRCCNA